LREASSPPYDSASDAPHPPRQGKSLKTIISVALAAVVAGVSACTKLCDIENTVSSRGIEMPDLDMLVGDTVEVDLGGYYDFNPGCLEAYRDYDRDAALFEVTSADPAVAVSIAADLTTLKIAALAAADSVRVTVVSVGPDHDQEFVVRARAR